MTTFWAIGPQLDQLNANTQLYFFQLYRGLDLDINKRFFLQYSTMFQLSNSMRLLRKKISFLTKNSKTFKIQDFSTLLTLNFP